MKRNDTKYSELVFNLSIAIRVCTVKDGNLIAVTSLAMNVIRLYMPKINKSDVQRIIKNRIQVNDEGMILNSTMLAMDLVELIMD